MEIIYDWNNKGDMISPPLRKVELFDETLRDGIQCPSVTDPSIEEKLKITKLGWEIKGARSVKNDIKIKEKFDFKQTAKDVLITSQLRTALITNKKIKSANYDIDTYKKIIYIYGISQDKEERAEVVNEAKKVLDVEDVITSIFLVEDLRVVKN